MLQGISIRTLILAAPWLIAAEAPPSPCGQAALAEQPAPLQQLGGPLSNGPLMGTAIVAPPAHDVTIACASPRRETGASRDPRVDALHGLPTPEVMPVMPSRLGD